MLEMTKAVPQIVRSFDVEFVEEQPALETATIAWLHYSVRVKLVQRPDSGEKAQ